MTTTARRITWILTVVACVTLAAPSGHADQQYAALEGVNSVDAVFDLRAATPQRTARYLTLIHETFRDPSLADLGDGPSLAVVVSGPAITHISTDHGTASAEDRQAFDQIASTVAAMAADGIAVEACLIAAASAGVAPESFVAGVTPVGNGWIAVAGYQAKGYSLVPVF